MAAVLTWYSVQIQAFGKLIYDLCGNHQSIVAAGTACAALILVASAAFKTRKLSSPAVWFLSAACCGFLGQIALRNGYFWTGSVLYLVSAVFVLRHCARVGGEYGLHEIKIGMDATVALMSIAVVCAVYLRFYNLGKYPAGLNNDEALFSYYGLLTLRGEALDSWWADNSRFMFVYLYSLAFVFKLFGASIFTARATSAFVGVLGVLALFLMADKLFKRAVALLGAVSLALCICSSGFDRIAHCMNWGTLFACLSLYLLFSAENRGMKYCGFFSGLVMALGLFTYDVYKGALLAILVFLIYRVLFQRRYLRENWFALVLLVAGFAIVAGPMLKATQSYTAAYTRDLCVFIGRPRLPQSCSAADLFLINIRKFVRMLFMAMSESIHLVRGGPILNDALVPLFFIGFVCALYNWKRYNYFLVLVWFILSPIAGILSWPCIRRIIIFMPALHLCVALGALLLLKNVANSIGLSRRSAFVAALLIMVFILWPVNAYIYFNRATAFSGPDLKELGEYADSQMGKRFVYITDIGEGPTIYFLTYESRRGEGTTRYYRFVGGEEMYDCIFNSPPRDSVFVSWKRPETMKRIAPLEKMVPFTEVEGKQHIIACTVYEKGLARWRGVKISYRRLAEEGLPTEWAVGKTESTEFDWRNYPLPYPFEALMEGSLYVPKEGRYEFQVAGSGETELYIDGDEISVAPLRGHYLKGGAHEILIAHVQPEPGALSITWGAEGKPRSPMYLWSDIVERLCGVTRGASGEIVVIDNRDDGFSVLGGDWIQGDDDSAFGGSYRWNDKGNGVHKVRWASEVPRDGYYEVYAMWTEGGNRATNAPYRIIHADGEEVRRVDQKKDGGRWMSLGTYPFLEGGEFEVILSDDADGYVIADAVKLEYRREIEPQK